jgi:hypothetical protein
VDETGKAVKLGDYFRKHPHTFSFYTCPLLLRELDGITSSLQMVKHAGWTSML